MIPICPYSWRGSLKIVLLIIHTIDCQSLALLIPVELQKKWWYVLHEHGLEHMLDVSSPWREGVLHCIVWRNSPQLTLGSKETGWRGLETFMSCDRSGLGENILDLIVGLGVDLPGPKMLGKATIRPGASVVFLIYNPCCWRIPLSTGKYCCLPHWKACGWQIAPALHSIWSEAAHTLLPVFTTSILEPPSYPAPPVSSAGTDLSDDAFPGLPGQ